FPWWESAWEKSLNALKGLVEVRRLNNNDAMLLAPEQAYFVRENLRLRLLDARTAVMQRNGEVYRSDLNNVEAAVKQYFDAKSPATQSWLKELSELKALDVRMISDDALKASLAAVRLYQDAGKAQINTEQSVTTDKAAATERNASAPAAASATVEVLPEAPALPSESKVHTEPSKTEQSKPKESIPTAPKVKEATTKGEKA
ncbi:MAG: uroporphyrinogen-III C-methyltransferase, partial [Shewanella sp.]